MQTSTRPRPHPGGQRRQHGAHISISDDTHHVTDAISSLYDYGDQQQQQHPQHQSAYMHHPDSQQQQHQQRYEQRHMMSMAQQNQQQMHQQQGRPLSFLPSARDEISRAPLSPPQESEDGGRSVGYGAGGGDGYEQGASIAGGGIPGKPLNRAKTFEAGLRTHQRPQHHTNRNYVVGRSASAPHEPALSPGLRSPADTATSSFPLNDIDYESSPAAVAQELSNLQAIRRMSMNVDAAGDPDLPSFGVHSMTPPGSESEEDDASRLFWVPASLHPELAPKEFKTFIETRMEALKRRSGEITQPSDSPSRSTSGGGLSRKKSMLSRQIDNSEGKAADGYQDGAERLERKRSSSSKDTLNTGMSNLHDLEVIVNDPTKALSRLSVEQSSGGESPLDGDMPILPAAPGGSGLRRSTRTTYRRGSLREGKRVPPSKRAAGIRSSDQEFDEPPDSPASSRDEVPTFGLSRVQTEPAPSPDRPVERPAENFSRPVRRRVGSPPLTNASTFENFGQLQPQQQQQFQQQQHQHQEYIPRKSPPPTASAPALPPIAQSQTLTSREPKPFVSQFASNGRTTAKVPAIVETPPPPDNQRVQASQGYRPPERSSSHEPVQSPYSPQPPQQLVSAPPMRSSKRSIGARSAQQNESSQTLQHMAAHPSPLPGNSTRTDSLSFIPTLTEDKKSEGRKDGGKKSGWGAIGSWLGGDDKEKQRRKELEARDAERNQAKAKSSGRPSDSTRLDVLQTTMDGTKGRESLVLERADVKLEEERRKETTRKIPESKKEKDGLLGKFGGLFSDKQKKPEREIPAKKAVRALSPEPPRPVLRPDVDYNWTRFSIIEERAIYRMAHIKLANPRRPLYSQVLLSNFMYSYLAKVQQMHPQMQIPQTAAAKAQQRAQQQQQQKRDQPEEFYQYQRYQEQLQEQDRAQQAQSHSQEQHDSNAYMDESQEYNYEDEEEEEDDRPESLANHHNGMANGDGYSQDSDYGYQHQHQHQQQQQQQPQQLSAYQYSRAQFEDTERAEDDDMW